MKLAAINAGLRHNLLPAILDLSPLNNDDMKLASIKAGLVIPIGTYTCSGCK